MNTAAKKMTAYMSGGGTYIPGLSVVFMISVFFKVIHLLPIGLNYSTAQSIFRTFQTIPSPPRQVILRPE
jgi:hypothetical protein